MTPLKDLHLKQEQVDLGLSAIDREGEPGSIEKTHYYIVGFGHQPLGIILL